MAVTTVDLGPVQGPAGKDGAAGKAATVRVGTVTAGSTPNVTNSGTGTDAVLNFVLPENTDADTVDGKHASEFATAEQGKKADAALPKADAWQISRKELVSGTVLADLPLGHYRSPLGANTFPDLPAGAAAAFDLDVDGIRDTSDSYCRQRLTDLQANAFIRYKDSGRWSDWVGPNHAQSADKANSAGELTAGHNQYGGNDYTVRLGYVDNIGDTPAVFFLLGNDIYNAPVHRAVHADSFGAGHNQYGGLERGILAGVMDNPSGWGQALCFMDTAGIYNIPVDLSRHADKADNASSNTFYVGNSSIYSGGPQYMEIRPGGEQNYRIVYGITETAWSFVNTGNGMTRLGSPNQKWRELWSANGVIQTSDRNAKNSIAELDDTALQLLRRLKPSRYRMNDGTAGRTHYGFIAQDVEAAMEQLGLTSLDFAGLCKDQRQELYQIITEEPLLNEVDGDFLGIENELKEEWRPVFDDAGQPVYDYSLRYDEFVPLAVLGAQEALRRTDALEAENKQLKDALAVLVAQVAALEKGA